MVGGTGLQTTDVFLTYWAWVIRGELGKDLHGQGLDTIGVVIMGIRWGKGFELDEGTATDAVVAVVEGGEGNEGVDILGIQDVFELSQTDGGAHCCIDIARIQLAMSKEVVVVGRGTPPGII